MGGVFVGVRHQGIGRHCGNGDDAHLIKHQRRRWPEGRQSAEKADHQRVFGTLIHRALSAVDVQRAMRGVMAILAVVVGLLLLVGAKHAGILPEGLLVRAEAREAAPSPPLTFEAARWRAFLEGLER